MSVNEIREFIPNTTDTDSMLSTRLAAVESMIRHYTNNNFQHKGFRITADCDGSKFTSDSLVPFKVDDTVMISESELMNGMLLTVASVTGKTFTVKEDVSKEAAILVTRVVYPIDVKMGAVNLLKWELENREKVGIASETISRHSVTYFNMDGDNSVMGYPKSLLGFLKPYMKARF